jgi:putative transcriptional regulator
VIPAHHPAEATLFDYGAGSLSEPLALAVATHVSVCRECRDKLHDIETIGGILLDDLPPHALAEDAFATTLQRLDRAVAAPPTASSSRNALQVYKDGGEELAWTELGRGIAAVDVVRRPGRQVRATLFKVARGTVLPLHGHRGREMTVVMEGAFEDETGRFAPGDFIEHDDGVVHRPAVAAEADCVCLIAVEGRLRFKGLWGRLIPLFVDL